MVARCWASFDSTQPTALDPFAVPEPVTNCHPPFGGRSVYNCSIYYEIKSRPQFFPSINKRTQDEKIYPTIGDGFVT